MNVFIYKCTDICMYVCMCVCACMQEYMHVCISQDLEGIRSYGVCMDS